MKKIISAMLSVVLLSALTVTAFAADPQKTLNPSTLSDTTKVTYTVAPTYSVTIPETVALGQTTSVTASNVVVAEGNALFVTVSSTDINAADNFVVRNGGTAELSYTITDGGSPAVSYLNNSVVLTVDPIVSATGSATLVFSEPLESVTYSGDYEATLTFTLSVAESV